MEAVAGKVPIGVFDSGVGGLTVLRALRAALPDEDFLYLGDTARVPYGTKSPASVTRYALQASRVLVEHGVKLLVVACNTASAVALDAVAAVYPSLPVVGVVEPGAAEACRLSRSRRIAVIATESTVKQGAYRKAIHGLAPYAHVSERACSLFVALAEEGWVEGPLVEGIVERYLAPLLEAPAEARPDCLLLGCTHFPVLAGAIARVVGPDVALIDSAATTAAVVSERLGRTPGGARGHSGGVSFLATDGAERFAAVGCRFLAEPIDPGRVEIIDL